MELLDGQRHRTDRRRRFDVVVRRWPRRRSARPRPSIGSRSTSLSRRANLAGRSRRIVRAHPTTTDVKDLKGCDLIVEAIVENVAIKLKLFKELDDLLAPHAIICTNTSSLCVIELGAKTKRPDKVAYLHFFNLVPPETGRGRPHHRDQPETATAFGQQSARSLFWHKTRPASRQPSADPVSALCHPLVLGACEQRRYRQGHEARLRLPDGPARTARLRRADTTYYIAEIKFTSLDPMMAAPAAQAHGAGLLLRPQERQGLTTMPSSRRSWSSATACRRDGHAQPSTTLNALNAQLLGELSTALASLDGDAGIRAVVITGSGLKAFAAGADIGELNALGSANAGADKARVGQAVTLQIGRLTKPVIAAVNGFALGGGCELAMAGDIMIASDNAKFGQPEVNLGLIPGYGGSHGRRTRSAAAAMYRLSQRSSTPPKRCARSAEGRQADRRPAKHRQPMLAAPPRSPFAARHNDGAHLATVDGLELKESLHDLSPTTPEGTGAFEKRNRSDIDVVPIPAATFVKRERHGCLAIVLMLTTTAVADSTSTDTAPRRARCSVPSNRGPSPADVYHPVMLASWTRDRMTTTPSWIFTARRTGRCVLTYRNARGAG